MSRCHVIKSVMMLTFIFIVEVKWDCFAIAVVICMNAVQEKRASKVICLLNKKGQMDDKVQ